MTDARSGERSDGKLSRYQVEHHRPVSGKKEPNPTQLYEVMKELWVVDWSTYSGLAYRRPHGIRRVGEGVGYQDSCMGGYVTSFQGRTYEVFRILVYLIQGVDILARPIVPLSEYGSDQLDPHRIPNKVNPGTGYRGVQFDKTANRYRAVITLDGKQKYIASYRTPIEAARAFNEAALKAFGDEAVLNDVD